MPSNISELLEAVRRLDIEALAAVYDAHSDELYRFAYRLTGDTVQAEDLLSETFSRFLRALERGGGPKTHLRAYLYRTTHNAAKDLLRRTQKELDDPSMLKAMDRVRTQTQAHVLMLSQIYIRRQMRARAISKPLSNQ